MIDLKKNNLKKIKLLLLDVDGILTSGKKIYSDNGNVIGKEYCDLDFTAIKIFKSLSIKVIFISGDQTCNKSMAKNRNVDFYYTRKGSINRDKLFFLKGIEKKYKINRKNIAFLGDDIFDLELGKNIGYFVVPNNSMQILKNKADYVLKSNSGNYLIKEFLDLYLKINKIKKIDIQKIYDLEKNEQQRY
jgi:3-deoxy-D-manno-octulosonate 8-phosphate phosphatase (KDO 8-P phosphatase)